MGLLTDIKDIGKPLYQALMVMVRAWGRSNDIEEVPMEALQAVCFLVFDEVFDFTPPKPTSNLTMFLESSDDWDIQRNEVLGYVDYRIGMSWYLDD